MKRMVMAVILVVILLPFTACQEELPASEEIIDNVIEAMGSAETCRAEGDMTMQLYFMAEEMPNFFPLDIEITADVDATYDIGDKEMEITGEVGFAGPDEEPIEIEMAMYLADEVIYIMYDVPIISPYWMKSGLPPGFERMIIKGIEQGAFLNMGDVVVVGEERKEGNNCYLLQIDIDLKKIIGQLLLPAQDSSGSMLEDELRELDQISSDITVKIWVDKDDYYIVYQSVDIDVEITPEMMGEYGEAGSFSLDATANTRYYDYNKKADITLPPEAEDAEEMDSW